MQRNYHMSEMNERNKKGILWFFIFLAIIALIAIYSNFTQIESSFESFISQARNKAGSEGDSRAIFNNKIVEEESTIIDVVDSVSPSVVSIVVKTVGFDAFSGPYSFEDGIGTGFVVGENGMIVTNSHVVDDPGGEYSVVLKDGTTYEVDDVHLDRLTDLAIIEITARDLATIELGDSENLKVGQVAIAIGNALGQYQNTVTVGVVSGIARELTATGPFGSNPKTYESVIQTDAALNPGNSGGPLLNSAGQVIGVNVAVGRGVENIGFSIPVNTLKPILESFLKEGKIIRPFIGVSYTIISKDLASIRRLPEGAFVSLVVPDSPADKAGIERGDIIVKIDDEEITTDNTLAKVISQYKVGDTVKLTIDRGGEDLAVEVKLESIPEDL